MVVGRILGMAGKALAKKFLRKKSPIDSLIKKHKGTREQRLARAIREHPKKMIAATATGSGILVGAHNILKKKLKKD